MAKNLEKWGDVILSRPDPQIIWKDKSFPKKLEGNKCNIS